MQRKICIILEMTVPMDVNIEQWHSVKLEKYQVDIQQEAGKDWSIYVYPIKVGKIYNISLSLIMTPNRSLTPERFNSLVTPRLSWVRR